MKGLFDLINIKQRFNLAIVQTPDKEHRLLEAQVRHSRFSKQNSVISSVKKYIITHKIIWYYPITKRV